MRHIRLCQRGAMATTERSVTVERTQPGRFVVTNDRGGRIAFGTGADADLTRSHDRLCTVGRTVELGTAITARVDGSGSSS